jgi:hypothetical protein
MSQCDYFGEEDPEYDNTGKTLYDEHAYYDVEEEAEEPHHPTEYRNGYVIDRTAPRGIFTGRCGRCGSSDIWDDNLHWGCKTCGAFNPN